MFQARIIYEDFISILSPKEVSLDSRVRETVNNNMQKPSANTFDDAQSQIYTLMQRDSYPRLVLPLYSRVICARSPCFPPLYPGDVSPRCCYDARQTRDSRAPRVKWFRFSSLCPLVSNENDVISLFLRRQQTGAGGLLPL